jgi:hypothetical protein
VQSDHCTKLEPTTHDGQRHECAASSESKRTNTSKKKKQGGLIFDINSELNLFYFFDMAHLFVLSSGQQEQQTERSRLSPELEKRTDARGVLPLTTAAGMDFK